MNEVNINLLTKLIKRNKLKYKTLQLFDYTGKLHYTVKLNSLQLGATGTFFVYGFEDGNKNVTNKTFGLDSVTAYEITKESLVIDIDHKTTVAIGVQKLVFT